MDDPYGTIRNIIEHSNTRLEWIKIKSLLLTIQQTLYEEHQTAGDKNKAIKLLIYLRNRYPHESKLDKTFTSLYRNKNEVLCANEIDVLVTESLSMLRFAFLILQVSFNKYDLMDVLTNMAMLYQAPKCEQISSL